MAGRKPKPSALKRLQGNPGHRKLNRAEHMPDATVPDCPDWLRDEAKAEWERVVFALHECGILTNIDRAALAAYCQAYARWREAEEIVAGSAQILKTAEGSVYISPALGAASMALKQLLAFAVQLGMTPSARSRIVVTPPKNEPTLADVLFEGAKQGQEKAAKKR